MGKEYDGKYIYIFVMLRPDSGPWPPLTGLHDHTYRTNHIR